MGAKSRSSAGASWPRILERATNLALRCQAALLLFTAGCGFGEGDGTLPPGPPQIPLEEGQTVGEFEVVIPNSDFFILHGTLPVPKGTYDPLDGVEPFGIVDADGQTIGAQAEVVSWYPNDAVDGAAVVEIVARVSRGGLPFGTRTSYRVVLASHPTQPDPGTPGAEDLLQGPLAIPTLVQALIGNPGSIELRSYDCFGNKYSTFPLNGGGEEQLLRHGAHTAEMRVYQHLAPNPPVSGAEKTLSHWLATHSYISTYNSEEFVTLDLRVSNADSGNITTISVDDPLDKVYFRSFEVVVPNGWVVIQDFEDPYFGVTAPSGSMTSYSVVNALGGKMHMIPWGWQFHRRLAICRPGQETKVREFMRGAGLGFSRGGLTPEGQPMWSWWNPATARWFPQAHLIPIFDHLGKSAVSSAIVSETNTLKNYIEGGGSAGDYPVEAAVLGWAHPYGIPYSGMTGGAEIHIFDGIRTVWAAETAGYQTSRIVHRMQTDRQSNVLYNWDGEPTSVEDWLKSSASGLYVPFELYVTPQLKSQDAFGLYLADETHINYVTTNNLKPDYESSLLEFGAHDYQHFIRYSRSAKVLAWMANDSVAKDDLRAQAENYKLAYHPYNNGAFGEKQVSGFANAKSFVDQHPGKGFGMGRGEGWGIDCSNAAYAIASRAWREERKPWFDAVSDNVFNGQAACSGFIQAVVNDKILDGNFRARQAYEHAIVDNMLRGMLESVFRGKDTARTAMVESILHDSFYALIGDISWGPGQKSPWMMTAVGPTNPSLPLYCSLAQLPPGGWSAGAYENFQNWSDFAYAYELTGDDHFLECAKLQIGGTSDLLTALEAAGLNNIENRAALLAICQYENGDF